MSNDTWYTEINTKPIAEQLRLLKQKIGDLDRELEGFRRHDLWLKSQEAKEEQKQDRKEERATQRQTRAKEALDRARADAIRAIAKLLPEAVKQAKAKPPRPALLRLILRATR